MTACKRLTPFLALLLGVVLAGYVRAQELPIRPEILRLFIIDVSGSMSGEKLALVKTTILEWTRTLPPSPVTPIVVVTFEKSASAPMAFTETKSLERFVEGLSAGGSTSLAAGLRVGASVLRNHVDVESAIVLFVSDGEDTVDPKAVPAAEAELDAIFAQRSREHLSSSVFVQRWNGANRALFDGSTHAYVYDLGEKRPVPLSIVPRATLLDAQWQEGSTPLLRVDLDMAFEVSGEVPEPETLAFEVTSRVSGAVLQRATDARLSLGEGRITLDLVPEGEPRELTIELAVQLLTHELRAGPILAAISPPTVSVRVPVPKIRVDLQALLAPRGAVWSQTGDVALELALSVNASSATHAWPAPIELEAEFSPARALEDKSTFSLARPGTTMESYSLHLQADGEEIPVRVRLVPALVPWPLELGKGELFAEVTVDQPEPECVSLRAEARLTREPLWASLLEGVVSAEVEVTVSAPSLPDGIGVNVDSTAIEGEGPRTVRGTFVGGKAVIAVRVALPMQPDERSALTFNVTRGSGIERRYTIEPTFADLELQAPRPAELHLLAGDKTQGEAVIILDKAPWEGSLMVTPTLVGSVEADAAEGLELRIDTPDSASGTILQVGVPAAIALHIPAGVPAFLDETIHPIEVSASLPKEVAAVSVVPGAVRATVLPQYRTAAIAGGIVFIVVVIGAFALRICSRRDRQSGSRDPIELRSKTEPTTLADLARTPHR